MDGVAAASQNRKFDRTWNFIGYQQPFFADQRKFGMWQRICEMLFRRPTIFRLYAASCRLWRAKTPNSTIQHCVVSPSIAYSGSETKLSAGAQLQTFTYSTIQNRFLNANGLMAIAQILPLKSVTVKKTIENSRRGNRGSPYRFCFWSLSDPIYSFAIIKGAEHIGQTHLRGKAVVRPA